MRGHTYLSRLRILSFQLAIDEAFVNKLHQCMAFDVVSKVKVLVRLRHAPLLLEFDRRLAIVCRHKAG